MTKKFTKIETYGGKLTENIVQAIARDCLAVTMLELERRGFYQVMHVHDETVAEVLTSEAEERLAEMCEVMETPIIWAKGLTLKADGYLTPYYKK